MLLAGLSACPFVFASRTEEAAALFRAGEFERARLGLEKIVSEEPNNAAACYHLGMVMRGGDKRRLGEAARWLRRATELEPRSADYLADYGGTELMIADRDRSLPAALRGRSALEAAVLLDPDDVDTRQLLFEFYLQAPWPLGSAKRAAEHLEAIRGKKPGLGAALSARLSTNRGDFGKAFQICEGLLAADPDDYTALHEYGWCALSSGQNLQRGIDCLKRAAGLRAPSPASPQPGKLWWLIGELHLKQDRREDAVSAFAQSVAFDPGEQASSARLRELGPSPHRQR